MTRRRCWVNFGLFDLVDKALTPRIRDLGKITLVRVDSPAATNALYPHAGPLLADRWNEDLVAGCWDDLLRMAGSRPSVSRLTGHWSILDGGGELGEALQVTYKSPIRPVQGALQQSCTSSLSRR